MSDYDRNVAARGFGAARAEAIDAGLRAYMIRVYNYMAAGVALTGVVAWLTFNAAVRSPCGGTLAADAIRADDLSAARLMIVLFLATLGLVFFMSFRISSLQPSTALMLFMVYAGLLGVMLSSVFLTYTDALDHPHLLHLGGLVRCVEPLRLHDAARSLANRVVPDHGIVRAHSGNAREHVSQEQRA